MTSGYSLREYGKMITCEPRMGAFAQALRRAITPGCEVIDLGAGPGAFALLACQYGAGHVTAIEPDVSISVARQMARDNGYADRITFVSDLSTKWQPTKMADVVISDIRGVMPLFEHHIPTIKDVRARLLKPGGIQIPGIDRIHAALVEAPDFYAEFHTPWLENAYGLNLSAAHVYAVNDWSRTWQPSKALLSEPQLFATLDYRQITDPNHRATMSFKAARPGVAHGILMWFETELVPDLAPGLGYSNGPDAPEQVYGQAFFPLESPISLAAGMGAEAEVSAHLIDGEYVWSWAIRATDTEGRTHAFRQSSFKSQILDRAKLSARASNFTPPATQEHGIDAYCLQQFDGETDLSQLADMAKGAFPDYFTTHRLAFDYVAKLSARYNKG